MVKYGPMIMMEGGLGNRGLILVPKMWSGGVKVYLSLWHLQPWLTPHSLQAESVQVPNSQSVALERASVKLNVI